LPEICLVGKSNVGKSSLINSLLGGRPLARVSKTPGRTQAVHFYRVRDKMHLVDLPGFGYASVSRDQKKKMKNLLISYINNRPLAVLRMICVLVDCRHGIKDDELDLFKSLDNTSRPYMMVLTKGDKVSPTELLKLQTTLEETVAPRFGGCYPEVLLTSSLTQYGVDRLRALLVLGQGECND